MQIVSSHPVLAVQDLQRSTDWYVRVFDCDAIEVDSGNWTFCRNGNVSFHLGHCPDMPSASEIGDHSYFAYLIVDDVDAFHDSARSVKVPRC